MGQRAPALDFSIVDVIFGDRGQGYNILFSSCGLGLGISIVGYNLLEAGVWVWELRCWGIFILGSGAGVSLKFCEVFIDSFKISWEKNRGMRFVSLKIPFLSRKIFHSSVCNSENLG